MVFWFTEEEMSVSFPSHLMRWKVLLVCLTKDKSLGQLYPRGS